MTDTLRFAELELTNWRNFLSVKVPLAPRTFLVGPNAIGKSNFLDAFRFLRDLTLEGGGLAEAVKLRGKITALRSLHARQLTDVTVACRVRDGMGLGWRYRLSFNAWDKKRDVPKITEEKVWTLAADSENLILDRPDEKDRDDPERLIQTAIQQTIANKEFRSLADFFRQVSYLHLVPQMVREEQRPRDDALGPDPLGRDLLDRVRHTAKRTRQARLNRIAEVLKSVVPQLQTLDLVEDDYGRPHLQTEFKHWRGFGAHQNETQLSDGTLRLIGLLWSLQEKGTPLLLEEPELSLHTAVVKGLAPFINRAQRSGGGRQVILSTHSENLLSDPGIAPEEVLLVQPANEGSEVIAGAKLPDVQALMMKGLTAAEAILPKTSSLSASGQLSLLDGLTA
jgi:predicted ATPase